MKRWLWSERVGPGLGGYIWRPRLWRFALGESAFSSCSWRSQPGTDVSGSCPRIGGVGTRRSRLENLRHWSRPGRTTRPGRLDPRRTTPPRATLPTKIARTRRSSLEPVETNFLPAENRLNTRWQLATAIQNLGTCAERTGSAGTFAR